nr:MAG TPA: hypothetical protein [Caudoviricetes sp.]DAK46225.1 MAG TPA: hypothetical protein [Caudoviricetes sp.]DAK46641.1 MAG TPA: hypothetical protein [Bacteriophage sp.]DAO61727.1 MAG TPA: hypothetical protein [Bacteriophage sp.]DAT20568.1 MAG TPA: hypothetical protein [Caudoviricetes sp.]
MLSHLGGSGTAFAAPFPPFLPFICLQSKNRV